MLKLLFGEKKELDDPALQTAISCIADIFDAPMFSSPVVALLPNPEMVSWPIIKEICQFDIYRKSMQSLQGLVREHLKTHEEAFQEESEGNQDFMNLFLKKIKEEKGEKEMGINGLRDTL